MDNRPVAVSGSREAQFRRWLRTLYGDRAFEVEVASADASFRRYFRIRAEGVPPRILMDAPPDKEDCYPFIQTAGLLAAAGVHVPEILHADPGQGFLLLEDLGTRQYLAELDGGTVESLYGDAMDALLRIQLHARAVDLPAYDESLLRREMDLFTDWLLGRHLGLVLAGDDLRLLADVADRLVENALEQPAVFVHRDYHSRNLMVSDGDNPGVIDFQDAVHGPVTYDLASLLRDCYIDWPVAKVDAWVDDYRLRAVEKGVLADPGSEVFSRWFDLMGAQRHLKAAGIFARLNHRDGKSGYLADIPRTLQYVVEAGRRRSALGPLGRFIETRVLPRL